MFLCVHHSVSMYGMFEEDKSMKEVIFLTSLMFVSASVWGMASTSDNNRKRKLDQTEN